MSIEVKFDTVGALYVRFLSDAKVARSLEVVPDALIFDLDADNVVIGAEALRHDVVHLIPGFAKYRLPEEAKSVDFQHLELSFVPMNPRVSEVRPAADI